jgi:hypothetical protein
MMLLPWIPSCFIAIAIALALIAHEPREVDLSLWPVQAQYSGAAGIFISLAFLFIFAAEISWWTPVPTLAVSAVLWLSARPLPRFFRLPLEVISIIAWPWGLVFAFAATEQLNK